MSTDTGHYYTRDGKAMHMVPYADKKRAGQMRPTTLADAKKLDINPSVSAYVKMLAAPGLNDWKVREAVRFAVAHPIHPGEDVDQYINTIIEKSMEQVGEAADLGTRVHKALEDFFTTGKAAPDDLLVYVEPTIDAISGLQITPIKSECVLVENHYGYAGTTDLIFEDSQNRVGIMDFKTKRSKKGEKPFKSHEHRMQLSAYWMAFWGPKYEMSFPAHAIAYNVYVSTTEPGRVDVVGYDDSDLRAAWKGFKACLELYRFTKGYDASQK